MKRAGWYTIVLWGCAALCLLTALPGCSGCRPDSWVKRKKDLDKLEEKKKEKEKRKKDFEIGLPRIVPGEEGTGARPMAKPGHWITVTHEVKANNFNFQAELHTAATDTRGRIVEVESTPFQLSSSRPAPLPKGQRVVFETVYYVPPSAAEQGKTAWLNRELRAARGGRLVDQPNRQPLTALPGYTYHFLVLAGDPDSYGYLKRLTAVMSPTAGDINENLHYYRVLLPRIDKIAPVPSQSLSWTSTAYVLWDDMDPTRFTRNQQEAFLDWLHWGGQLIVSGPNSLEKLKGSFLDPYLPATALETFEIGQEAIDEINQYWTLPDSKTGQSRSLSALPSKPLVGVRLDKHAESRDLPGCAGLVSERRIGQGRVVVTSFSLTDRLLLTWHSYDSFFNACLLRRPRREFRKENFLADAYWADYHPSQATDPRFCTTLRYFSRDIGHFAAATPPRETEGRGQRQPGGMSAEEPRPPVPVAHSRPDDWYIGSYSPRLKEGVAAWNDRSGAADAARESLKDAAGISIPKGQFVLRVLAIYLLVLAPLNWAFFRLLGRVEWAWMAAPLIAIAGALAVVRFAQLDIGFARSLTEIAIAEMHAEYPRAHVTRYTALYTSLSTGYDFVFDDPASVAQPFAAQVDYQRSPHDAVYTVSLRRRQQLRLSGFRVPSNTTGIVHCEQMCNLGGVFRLVGDDRESFQIQNGTGLSFRDVGVLRRTEEGRLEGAWVGDLASKTSTPLEFADLASQVAHLEPWDRSLTTLSYEVQLQALLRSFDGDNNGRIERSEARADPQMAMNFDRLDVNANGRWDREEAIRWCRKSRAGDVSLGQLIELASRELQLRPGDMRLIGWTDEAMPELTVAPLAAQATQRTLLLVHLRRGQLPPPRPDKNCKADVVDETQQDSSDPSQEEQTLEEGTS